MFSRNIKITNIKIYEARVSGVQQTAECSSMVHADQTKVLCCSANRSAVETLLLVFRYGEAFRPTVVEGVLFNDAIDCYYYTGLVGDE
jgi:hypothetical protein